MAFWPHRSDELCDGSKPAEYRSGWNRERAVKSETAHRGSSLLEPVACQNSPGADLITRKMTTVDFELDSRDKSVRTANMATRFSTKAVFTLSSLSLTFSLFVSLFFSSIVALWNDASRPNAGRKNVINFLPASVRPHRSTDKRRRIVACGIWEFHGISRFRLLFVTLLFVEFSLRNVSFRAW